MRETYRTRSQRRDSRDSYYPTRRSGYRRDSANESDFNAIICAVILAAIVIVACFIVV